MSARWRKVAGDFRRHRIQIALIGIVLVIGAGALIAALNARVVLKREIAHSYAAARSPDLVLTFDAVAPAMLEIVRSREDVADAQARRLFMTRMAGRKEDWLVARVVVIDDFQDQRVGAVHRHEPGWPPTARGVLIEQSSLPLLGVAVGESIRVRVPGGAIVALPVAGTVHDTAMAPGFQEQQIYAYCTPAVAAQLGLSPVLDQIVVRMNNRATGPSRLIADLQEMLAEANITPLRSEILRNAHPHANLMEAMLMVLAGLAAMAFFCCSALASYVASLWMKREVRQVGLMKTIGATSGQLAVQYLALVGPVVIAAAMLALPLAAVGAGALIRFNAASLNIDVIDSSAPSQMLLVEFALSLAVPFLAMAFPILRAARQNAHTAIHDPGITAQAAPRPLVSRVFHVPGSRQWTFALRNLFRRPWRLVLTLTALSVGGAVLLTANSVFASVMRIVDLMLAKQSYDIEVLLQRPAEIARLQSLARNLPDIEVAEAWPRSSLQFSSAVNSSAGDTPQRGTIVGYPADTHLLGFPPPRGRWPTLDESDAVVIGRPEREALGIGLGDTVELQFGARRPLVVRVVGEVEGRMHPSFYAPFPLYEKIYGTASESATLLVKAKPGRIDAAETALDLALIAEKIVPAAINTREHRRTVIAEHFLDIVGICNLIATAAALFGAISLAAFGALNVLERAREIGVVRTLGATPRRIVGLLVLENAAVVAASAALAVAVSLVATRFLLHRIEEIALRSTIPPQMSFPALGVLAGGLIVVLVAVWFPVSRLVKVTVREALSYE